MVKEWKGSSERMARACFKKDPQLSLLCQGGIDFECEEIKGGTDVSTWKDSQGGESYGLFQRPEWLNRKNEVEKLGRL